MRLTKTMPEAPRSVSQPAIQAPSAQTPNPSPRQPVIKWAVLAAVIILVAGAAWWGAHSRNLNKSQPYRYHYASLQTYNLGQTNGQKDGLSFKNPQEFRVMASRLNSMPKSVALGQAQTAQGTGFTIGFIAANYVTVKDPVAPAYLKSLDQALTDVKNPNHVSYSAPLLQFATDNISVNYKINFGTPVRFTNPNIKANAWQVGFTYTLKPGQNVSLPAKKQGTAILAVGNRTYYYFMLTAVGYNWQSNQAAFSQVLNSIKIDQAN